MVVDIRRQICDGHMLKWLTAAGLSWLEHHQETVNQMNVFPVPDGDTGTNMRLTMQKAYEAVANTDDSHVGIVSDAIAKGALRGARGNSGVILSQLLYGFSQTVRGHEVFDAKLFAQGCQKAVEAAYKAVSSPVEGTILTVAREAMEAVVEYVKTSNDLSATLDIAIKAGQESLARTPDLLPVLKKVNKVDSGGMGLMFILEGMARLLRGEQVSMAEEHHTGMSREQLEEALAPEDEEGYGYDVQFLMHGKNMDVARVRADIEAMGWSTLVVGDSELIKVHVHVHDPGVPISYAVKSCMGIDDIVVENMQLQFQDYVKEQAGIDVQDAENLFQGAAVIAVASGEGLRQMFKNDLGVAAVVLGGQTMNSSTEDFMEAIDAVPNNEIILLPNNKNIIMAAQQAASMVSHKQVRIVPSRTLPQGIAALIEYLNVREDGTLDDITEAMTNVLDTVKTGEVTIATNAIEFDDLAVDQGQPIALLNGQLAAVGDTVEGAAQALLEKARADESELITLYYGSDVKPEQAEQFAATLADVFPDQEIQVVYGGQPLYPYLISIE